MLDTCDRWYLMGYAGPYSRSPNQVHLIFTHQDGRIYRYLDRNLPLKCNPDYTLYLLELDSTVKINAAKAHLDLMAENLTATTAEPSSAAASSSGINSSAGADDESVFAGADDDAVSDPYLDTSALGVMPQQSALGYPIGDGFGSAWRDGSAGVW